MGVIKMSRLAPCWNCKKEETVYWCQNHDFTWFWVCCENCKESVAGTNKTEVFNRWNKLYHQSRK